MRNVLILHGTNSDSRENWFPWLKRELSALGYSVWCPDLPRADTPNIRRYNEFIFANKSFVFSEETLVVGHSSGAVAALGLLQHLPPEVKVGYVYLVSAFKDDLGWKELKELFAEPFDLNLIKRKAKGFIFIHSDNDPYCPLKHARFLARNLGGRLIIIPGNKHFSVGTMGERYREFPKLLEIIRDHSAPLK